MLIRGIIGSAGNEALPVPWFSNEFQFQHITWWQIFAVLNCQCGSIAKKMKKCSAVTRVAWKVTTAAILISLGRSAFHWLFASIQLANSIFTVVNFILRFCITWRWTYFGNVVKWNCKIRRIREANAAVAFRAGGRPSASFVHNGRFNWFRNVKLAWGCWGDAAAFAGTQIRSKIARQTGEKARKPGRRPPFSRGRKQLCTDRRSSRALHRNKTAIGRIGDTSQRETQASSCFPKFRAKNRGENGEKRREKRRHCRREKRETRRGRRPPSGAPTRERPLARGRSRDRTPANQRPAERTASTGWRHSSASWYGAVVP